MQHFPNCGTTNIKDAPLGTCVVFTVRDQSCIGMTVEPGREGDLPDVLALSPGHPGLNGLPGLLNGSVVKNQTLLTVPDARIVLPSDPREIRLGNAGLVGRAGAAMTAGGETGISAIVGNAGALVFNVRTGALMDEATRGAAWFSSWQIVVPGPNGELAELCRVRADTSERE